MALPVPDRDDDVESGESNGGSRQGIPFLTMKNMSKKPAIAKLLSVREDDRKDYNDVIIKIEYEGKRWKWGLKFKNPNYKKLAYRFGGNETDWENQEFRLYLKYDQHEEKDLPFVDFDGIKMPEKPEKTKGK